MKWVLITEIWYEAEAIDDAFTSDAMLGLLGEVADLKGVTESQLIVDIKTRRGA